MIVTDAQGRSGGSSDIVPIGASNDATCLNANSPSSTAGGPTSTTNGSSSSTTTKGHSTSSNPPQSSAPAKSGGSNGAVIGGAVAGAVVAIVLILAFVFFFLRHRKNKNKVYGDSRPQRMQSIDHLPGPLSASTAELGEGRQHDYVPVPYVLPPSEYGGDYSQSGRQPGTTEGRSQTPLSMLSSAPPTSSSKAALAAQRDNQAPTRFVLHTDAGSAYGGEREEEDEVVELPPQYTSLSPAERKASIRRDRAAARGSTGASGVPGPSSSAGPSAP